MLRFKKDINFIGNRNIFFIISGVLVAISIIAILARGLTFGIEFQGGTSTVFNNTGDITVEQVREQFTAVGDDEAIVQNTTTNGENGFIVRTTISDPDVATNHGNQVAQALGLPAESVQINTVGPDWGSDVTKRSFAAFIVSILLIIAYIAIRYRDYKMGVSAIIALIHDLVIVIGVYALVGREITPNVIAALLTIMGYSLYDTVVVFHRIKDNASSNEPVKTSFYKMANHSINQVFTRTINTTLTSVIPVICMLAFGGATLVDFAFAMLIGLILGSYSSIGIASPIYCIWKSREPELAKRNKKFPDDLLPKRKLAKLEASEAVE